MEVTMESEELKIVYQELYVILNGIMKNKVMKIPKDILNLIINNRDSNYKVDIEWNKPLEKQNLHEDTINCLGLFYYSYWTDSKEEKEELRKIFYKDEIEITQRKEDLGMIEVKDNSLENVENNLFKRLFSKLFKK